MVTKARGEFVDVTESINLTIEIKNTSGVLIDADTFPQISLVQPNGLVYMNFTSAGVERISTGKYSYTFTVPYNGYYGVWNDVWRVTVSAQTGEQALQFIVSPTQMPALNSDGYVALGDDPGFNFSQGTIKNINKLIAMMRARLNSEGKSVAFDKFGNKVYVSCDIYSVKMLTTFLIMVKSYFNSIPYFTTFEYDDDYFVNQFGEILVEGAVLYALASKALIERGREFQITDNSLNFQPPTVSELLQTQYSGSLQLYYDQVKYIKNSMRPYTLGLGTFSMTSGGLNPAVRRLRFLRQRRIL